MSAARRLLRARTRARHSLTPLAAAPTRAEQIAAIPRDAALVLGPDGRLRGWLPAEQIAAWRRGLLATGARITQLARDSSETPVLEPIEGGAP
jgi:hypothetical protein